MQYSGAGTGAVGNLAGGHASQPKDPTLLETQVRQIESRLKGLSQTASRIGGAIERLINPRPANACSEISKAPDTGTIEARLQNIVRMLDGLESEFTNHANTLDQAI